MAIIEPWPWMFTQTRWVPDEQSNAITGDNTMTAVRSVLDVSVDASAMPDFVPSDSYEVGDVVKLKSFGPMMTVWEVRPGGIVDVCWFSARNELQRDAFASAELLKRVYPED